MRGFRVPQEFRVWGPFKEDSYKGSCEDSLQNALQIFSRDLFTQLIM